MTVVNINFDKTGSSAVSGYNNLYTNANANALLDSTGSATAINFVAASGVTVDYFNNAGYADSAANGVPIAVWDSFWFSSSAFAPVYTLTGFTPNEAVTLTIAGFKGNQNWDTQFTVNGASQIYDCVGGAIPQTPPAPLVFSATADGSGEISITQTALSSYSYLTFLSVEYGATYSITDIDGDNNVQAGQTGAVITTVGILANSSTQSVTLGSEILPITNWS